MPTQRTHEFRLVVKSDGSTRKVALFKVLCALKFARPSGCKFQLKNLPPDSASQERAAIKRFVLKEMKRYPDHATPRWALKDVLEYLNARTKRTAARKGLGRKG